MTQPAPPRSGPTPEAERAPPLPPGGGGALAATFISALAKAARSFTLYDPSNAVVRQFLADYQARATAATAGGDMVLDIRPFELVRDGEVVYLEEDRERSLAFKLFRDGVRRLTFRPGIPWSELLAFLEILAIRYVGVRQQEEDVVTLLRKADFKKIGFAAVEGFTPDEENPEGASKRRAEGQGTSMPPGFDTPFPLLPPPGPIAWVEVPEAARAALRAEDGPEALAGSAIRMAATLLGEALGGRVPAQDAQQFLAELRDYLIADQALAPLAALADLVGRIPAGPLRDEVLRSMADPRLLQVLVSRVPAGQAQLPPEAARLLPLVPGDAALDLLASEPDAGRRAVLLLVAEARLPADAAAVVERLPTLEPGVARALVKAVGARAPAFAAAAAAALLDHTDEQLQLAALEALEASDGEVPVPRMLRLLQSPREPIRIGAAHVLARLGKPAGFQPVLEALERRKDVSRAEADALGRAMARLDPGRAADHFIEWLKPRKGLLSAFSSSKAGEGLRFAAISGMADHPAPDALTQLEALSRSLDDEALRRHCLAVLARRRSQGARRG